MKEKKDLSVSVCIITYNHAAFIKECLEGVLNQQTTCAYEVIIGEDASVDHTRSICEEYAARFPDRIKLISNSENIGVKKNLEQVLQQCNGKYIAFCEGDDCWTDMQKLQKQFEFLEDNEAYSLCSTRYEIVDTTSGKKTNDGADELFGNVPGVEILPETMFDRWLTKTCTVMYRANTFSIHLIGSYRYFRDVHLFYHILRGKKGYCLNINTSIYNLHNAGIWSSKNKEARLLVSLKVFKELFRKNKTDESLQKVYMQCFLQYIDYRIKHSEKPFFTGLHIDILKYGLLLRKPGLLFLKYRQLIKKPGLHIGA